MFDIEIKIDKLICHSGGAKGSDSIFESVCMQNNIEVKAYSYKTPYHTSTNKIEISEEDYKEGMSEIYKANRFLNRWGINKYMNLLARNWAQIKYSESTYAIGHIVNPKEKTRDNYVNNSKLQIVDGGTGYAVMMGIIHNHPTFVFDQVSNEWFEWHFISQTFKRCNDPIIKTSNFAGIGTREINDNGIVAITKLIKDSILNLS